jgi:ribosome-binding protein aMBF1 (putative translation factor)
MLERRGQHIATQLRETNPQQRGKPGDVMPEATEGPTVLRILLGTQVRRLRESRGVSAHEAARAIRGSESKISRIELGRNAVREIDVLDLLTYYGVGALEREQLLSLAEQANRPGWWHRARRGTRRSLGCREVEFPVIGCPAE